MAETGRPREIYAVDSSSWIAIEGHPDQNRIRSTIIGLIEAGRLRLCPEVWNEIELSGSLATWLEPHKKALMDSRRNDADYMQSVGLVAFQFPAMAGVNAARRNKADPWLIALALQSLAKGEAWAVVCNETVTSRPNRKMPTACAHFNVPCYSLLDMLRREFPDEGW